MPEIPDRVPGGVILASYSNDVRDRICQRYASAVERDSLTPLPAEGELAYLQDQNVLQVFKGTWMNLVQQDQWDAKNGEQDARLDTLEDYVASPFTETPKSFDAGFTQITGLTIPTAGDWLLRFNGKAFTSVAAILASPAMQLRFLVDGVQQIVFARIGSSQTGVWGDQLAITWPRKGLVAGNVIHVDLRTTSAQVDAAEVEDYFLEAQRMPTGKVPDPA
jgi:hypothetical protein